MTIDSSVARALHQYRRGHWFESCSGLNFFFQALISQLLNDQSCLHNIRKQYYSDYIIPQKWLVHTSDFYITCKFNTHFLLVFCSLLIVTLVKFCTTMLRCVDISMSGTSGFSSWFKCDCTETFIPAH